MCVICSRCKQPFFCPHNIHPWTKKGILQPHGCPANFNYVSSCKDCWAKEGLIGWAISGWTLFLLSGFLPSHQITPFPRIHFVKNATCTAKNNGDATQSTQQCSSMRHGQPFQTKNDGFGCVKSAFTAYISMNIPLKTSARAEKITSTSLVRSVSDEATYKTTNDSDPRQHSRSTPGGFGWNLVIFTVSICKN